MVHYSRPSIPGGGIRPPPMLPRLRAKNRGSIKKPTPKLSRPESTLTLTRNNNDSPMHVIVNAMHMKYMRDFYPYQPTHTRRVWTRRSIYLHLTRHGGLSQNAQTRQLIRSAFTSIHLITETMMKVKSTTTKETWLAPNGVKLFCQMCALRSKLIKEIS